MYPDCEGVHVLIDKVLEIGKKEGTRDKARRFRDWFSNEVLFLNLDGSLDDFDGLGDGEEDSRVEEIKDEDNDFDADFYNFDNDCQETKVIPQGDIYRTAV